MTDQLAPPGTFRRFVWDNLSPRVFRGYFGRRMNGMLALLFDDLAEASAQAVKAHWIYENPPPDALGPLGREMLLRRYPTETTAQYKARIARGWDDWQLAGDESSIVNQLAAAGHPGAVIYRWLGSSSWSEFVVFFPAGTHNVTAAGPLVGSFVVGDGSIIGIVGLTPVELNTLRGIVRQWKPGRWKCARIVFELSGWTIGTEHTVGEVDLVIGGSQAFVGAL